MSGCGAGRAIPIISSNGSAGSPIRCSRSISPAPIRGAGARLLAPAVHVLAAGARLRHSAAGRAHAALARRALSRLSGAHQRSLSGRRRKRGEISMSADPARHSPSSGAPLPDAVTRAGMSYLVGRGPRQTWRRRRRHEPRFAGEHARRSDRRTRRAANAPALRGAAAFFALVLGPHRKYSCCYYEAAHRRWREAEKSGADAETVRACRPRRRPGDPGTGLRLGLAVAVDGRAATRRAHHRGVEFALASAHTSKRRRRARA